MKPNPRNQLLDQIGPKTSDAGVELGRVAQIKMPAGIARLPGQLQPWCVLAPRVPAGWIVTPPFQLAVGDVWVIVARSTAADPDPARPPFVVEIGTSPARAVLNLAACFED